jgi:hypothetical protein
MRKGLLTTLRKETPKQGLRGLTTIDMQKLLTLTAIKFTTSKSVKNRVKQNTQEIMLKIYSFFVS